MSTNPAIHVDGKKYLWDGCRYDCDSAASRAAASYQEAEFEVRVEKAGEEPLVYTRRVVQPTAVATKE